MNRRTFFKRTGAAIAFMAISPIKFIEEISKKTIQIIPPKNINVLTIDILEKGIEMVKKRNSLHPGLYIMTMRDREKALEYFGRVPYRLYSSDDLGENCPNCGDTNLPCICMEPIMKDPGSKFIWLEGFREFQKIPEE